MPEKRGLVVFDLDGTLLRGPTVCELLAASLGRLDEMKKFEAMSTQEAIGQSRAEMAQWYQGTTCEALLGCLESPSWAPGAQQAIRLLRNSGVETVIASITWEFAVECIAVQVGVDRFLGTRLRSDGTIDHVWAQDKALWVSQLAAALHIPYERTAAVGDSENDIAMLKATDLRFFVGPTRPAGLDCIHAVHGDLLLIAEEIISRWDA